MNNTRLTSNISIARPHIVSHAVLHILLVLGMVFAPVANRALAQDAAPPLGATPFVPPVGMAAIPEDISPVAAQAAAQAEVTPVASEVVTDTVVSATEATSPTQRLEAPPLVTKAYATLQANGPNAPEVQGVVQLDVSVADTVRAGNTVVYTFLYSNTGGSPANNVIVDANWTDFNAYNGQLCLDVGCPAQSVTGPSVLTTTPPSNVSMRYVAGTLNGNQSGQFSVVIRIYEGLYPKSEQQITRPAGSGRLYVNSNDSALISDDTANTMVIGPVLVLTKTATSAAPIYTGDNVEFNIRVGNATAAGDSVGGSTRADARNATNVVMVDRYPVGSAFVSATGPYVIDNAAGLITWTFPSLVVSAFQDVKVIFKKVDAEADCYKIENYNYTATSNEYPLLYSGTQRAKVAGPGISVPVVPPLQIDSVIPELSSIYYGNTTTVTIVVGNHYTQALTGVEMIYVLPGNLTYVDAPLGATSLITIPTTPLSKTVGWRFDLPAATTKTSPATKTFTVIVRGGFYTQSGVGVARVVKSGNIVLPLFCAFKAGGPQVEARLQVTKLTDLLERRSTSENVFYATPGEKFPYVITLTNRSVSDVIGLILTDTLPGDAINTGANFSYVADSGTLGGSPRNPDDIINGYAGQLVWRNVFVPANSTVVIRYKMLVSGLDYVKYCNTIAAYLNSESFQYAGYYSGEKGICVKINPRVNFTKTADRAAAAPGEEVKFYLSLTNNETVTYNLGLYDVMGDFDFIRQESGYAQPYSSTSNFRDLEWPLVPVAPGQTIAAVIVVRMPAATQASFVNILNFRILSHGLEYRVHQIPSDVMVTVAIAAIQFTKSVDRSTAGLRDQMNFALNLKNLNPTNPVNNVMAVDVLPPGFIYVGPVLPSDVIVPPTQSVRATDGRTQLVWNIGTMTGNTSRVINYAVRTSETVGDYQNWLLAFGDGAGGRCQYSCVVQVEDGITKTYTYAGLTIAPLNTIAPQVTNAACANPGDTRVYRLTMVNTNIHAYNQITVSVNLPMGLRFSRAISGTTAPQVSVDSAGQQTVRWVNQTINAKPNNVFAAQVEYWIELAVGNVLGGLDTSASAASPDGLIPRKDGVSDPTIPMCAPASPAMVKSASVMTAASGSEIVYQIMLANPTGSAINTVVSDPLPAGFSFVGMVQGPQPVQSGNTLTWTSVSVPPSNGLTKLTFRALVGGETNKTVTNTAQSALSVITTNARASVFVEPPKGNIVGFAFADANANGTQDGGETGLSSVTVNLSLSNGQVLVSNTNASGAFAFTGVAIGLFTVTVAPVANKLNSTPLIVNGTLSANETRSLAFGFAPLPSIGIADVSVNEGDTGSSNAALVVSLSRAVGVNVSVSYVTADSTAQAGSDYSTQADVLVIPAGATNGSIVVPVLGDTTYEVNEIALVNLSSPVNAVIGTGQAQLTIVNDDPLPPLPILSIGNAQVTEGNSGMVNMVFNLTLSSPATQTVSVNYTTRDVDAQAGTDYVVKTGSVTINAGSSSAPIIVSVKGDTTFEANETFAVDLSAPVNAALGQATAIGTILNDDAIVFVTPTIRIANASNSEGNVGFEKSMVFTVTLGASTGFTVTVDYTTVNGTADAADFEAKAGTLVFAPGIAQQLVVVRLNGDTTYEPNEVFSINLSNPTHATLSGSSAQGTIVNDDLPPGVKQRVFLPMIRK